MKLVIFGLTISSSWGNGHATIWRALGRALKKRGHRVVFFEKNQPFYEENRDSIDSPGIELVIYNDWAEITGRAANELSGAEAGIVTSYCPDGIEATALVQNAGPRLKIFYDLDSPVTLENIKNNKPVPYIGTDGLRGFDLVLSYTGGGALSELKKVLGAKEVVPLYGCVDPLVHRPVRPRGPKAGLSFLGTYSADRQGVLEELFLSPSKKLGDKRFVIGGSLYPEDFPWEKNIYYLSHVPPAEHPLFYSSSYFTLNITRGPMAELGFCPSGRLFEAAACGTPVISDYWHGMEMFFAPGKEIIIAEKAKDVVKALSMTARERRRFAKAARERALEEHTGDARAAYLENVLEHWLKSSRSVENVGDNSCSRRG